MKAVKTLTVVEAAVEAISRIGKRDAQIAPLAKMNREDWLLIGEALYELRQKHKSDNAYGQAVREAGLDQGCCKHSPIRSDAQWFYENKTAALRALKPNSLLCQPQEIRKWFRGQSLPERIEQIDTLDLIDFIHEQLKLL